MGGHLLALLELGGVEEVAVVVEERLHRRPHRGRDAHQRVALVWRLEFRLQRYKHLENSTTTQAKAGAPTNMRHQMLGLGSVAVMVEQRLHGRPR